MPTLITGFEPFGDLQVNPSQLIVEHFQAQQRPDRVALVLPTAYQAAGERIEAAIQRYQPDAILALGVAQSRKTISLERIAVNVDQAALADNAGVLASGELIAEDGPIAYWSTLPIQPMLAALQAKDIPASISNHAGTFVCNHTFYSARRAVERLNLAIPCGFIHVPDLLKSEGEVTTGLPLEVMIEAVEICLDVVRQTLQAAESV
ncbi:MAG TPA: hypothetical protein VHD90_18470 [Phototrophicaceae bacterium]|nr:hypothetical protein [Phototrophicaceae bacterium]